MSALQPVFASVDLGGTKIACAIGRDNGVLLADAVVPAHAEQGPDAVLARIAGVLEELAEGAGAKPLGIGMGVPGLADRDRGITLLLPNLPTQWRGVPVAHILGERAGCPVYLLNDVRTATLGELTFGAGRRVRDLVFFAVGTGIGGGIVLDGKLRLGPLGAAGELGHQTVLPNGPLCGCGNRGCLETLASGPAITAEGVRLFCTGLAPKLFELTGGRVENVNPALMAQAAEGGDEAVADAIRRAAVFLGIGVANIVTALHPEVVVIGGGVAAIGSLLFDTVESTVRQRVRMFPAGSVRIVPSELADKAGLYGGLALAIRKGILN